ncbi:unnamed protein product, partial [Rotaria sp. Silwood2]
VKISNEKSSRKDALATTLVLIVCRAYSNIDINRFSSSHFKYTTIPIDSTILSKMLEDSQHTNDSQNTLPIEWNLYDFFRAPGIYYRPDDDNDVEKILYYGSDPSMMPNIYGYRLGTLEEVHVLKKLNQLNK